MTEEEIRLQKLRAEEKFGKYVIDFISEVGPPLFQVENRTVGAIPCTIQLVVTSGAMSVTLIENKWEDVEYSGWFGLRSYVKREYSEKTHLVLFIGRGNCTTYRPGKWEDVVIKFLEDHHEQVRKNKELKKQEELMRKQRSFMPLDEGICQ